MAKSCCGFDCEKCPLNMATKYKDEEMHKQVENAYQLAANSQCLGCLSDKPCASCQACQIRSCCLNKSITNCGQCENYPECKTILVVINTNQASKEFLDSEKSKFIKVNKK